MDNTDGSAAPQQNSGPTQNQGTGGETAPQAAQQATGDSSMLMSILAYIGPLVFVPLLMENDENETVKFHIRQGLVLLIIEAAAGITGWMIPLLMFPAQLIQIGAVVLAIIGVLNVTQGKQKLLPLIGKYADHFKV